MAKSARKVNATTQKFTEIQDVLEDIVILANGNACLVIEVTATNFALLSAQEQDSKIYSYAALLNSLSFTIQILIRSKKLDITSYLKLLDQEAIKTQNPLLAEQIRLYKDFIQELIKVNTVLDKKFYIAIPFSYLEKGVGAAVGSVNKKTIDNAAFIQNAKTSLHSKAESLHSQLARLNLRARTLEKEELIKLFYEIYNDTLIEINQAMDNIKSPIVKSEGGR
jgi:hypothetical protein